jgi:putative transposase
VRVRYHPEDLSCVFVSADGKNYVAARFADLRRPSISLWEQRSAVRALREQGEPKLSEQLIFKAIENQRRIVEQARHETRKARSKSRLASDGSSQLKPPDGWPSTPTSQAGTPTVDYSKTVDAFPVEMW